MNEWRTHVRFGLSALAMGITACSSLQKPGNGNDVYWQNQQWDKQLFFAVQSGVHYPLDDAGRPIGMPITAHGKVEFTYLDGKIVDPEIVESTGRPDLDAALLQQVSATQVPKASGPRAKEPHAFALALEMLGPMESFERAMYEAIDSQKRYPRESILSGAEGLNTVAFDYTDGKASDITVSKSSGDKNLDASSVQAVTIAQLPPSPIWLTTRPLRMKVSICYELENSSVCPRIQHIIEIVNTPPAAQETSPPSGS